MNFYKADGTTPIGAAYLLFATQTQINLFVPPGVIGNASKIAVTFNGNAGTHTRPTSLRQRSGGVHDQFFRPTAGRHPACQRLLGQFQHEQGCQGLHCPDLRDRTRRPNSTATNTNEHVSACVSRRLYVDANYLNSVNTAASHPSPTWTSLDGAVILSSVWQRTASHPASPAPLP